MNQFWIVLTSTVAACLCSVALMPVIIKLSHRRKWYDIPDNRKIHKGLIPRLGGVCMFSSVVAVSVLVSAVSLLLTGDRIFFQLRFLAVFAAFAIIHYTGLYDDFFNLRPLPKLVIQCMAGVVVAVGGFTVETVSLPWLGTMSLGLLSYPLTVLWLVGISNALNLMDGMDGLAGGIAAFAAASMGTIALIQGRPTTALLAFILFGSIIGFLVFNFPPAKIFMGDSGSLFLGFALALLPLMGISKAASFGTLIIPVTLLTVPIIDTLAAIIRRMRQGRSIISPDKDHIHHKLLYMGLDERKILLLIYGFCLYLSIVAITSVILPKETNVYFILVVWIGSLLGYYFLDILKERKTVAGEDENKRDKPKSSSAS